MGTLKTTLKVESTDLFPTPVSFTNVNNNTVAGTFSGFNNVVCSTAATTLNLGTIDSACYVYAQNATTSGTAIWLQEAGGTVFAVLAPGDVAFFPYGDGVFSPAANLEAVTAGGTASLNFFVGEKA